MNGQNKPTTSDRIERALHELERVEPAPDLSRRILAALPREAQPNPWLGVTTLLAALIGFALVYQTAFTLRANGAFELLSYYTSQPEIVTTYPGEAWTALSSVVPWMTVTISIATLALALFLMYRWSGRNGARVLG